MILTCPACATRYFVDDAQAPAGRKVRCSACGEVWRAETAEGVLAGPAPGAAAEPPADAPISGDPLPGLFSLKAAPQPAPAPSRRRMALTAALALVALAGLAALFRTEAERAWPASRPVYAAILGGR